jgi:hypothetical protein
MGEPSRALDTSPLPYPSSEIRAWTVPYSNDRDDTYDLRISMKRKLVLVCKAWQQLTTDMLYEHVRVQSVATITSFAGTLERNLKKTQNLESRTTDGTNHSLRPYGFYTKRLDIASAALSLSVSVAALRLCNDLRILDIAWDSSLTETPFGVLPSSLVREVLHRSKSLVFVRTLQVSCSIPLLHGLQHFRKLQILHIYALELEDEDAIPYLSLSELHTLELHGTIDFVRCLLAATADWTLPSLRSVSLFYQRPESEPTFPLFFESQPQNYNSQTGMGFRVPS